MCSSDLQENRDLEDGRAIGIHSGQPIVISLSRMEHFDPFGENQEYKEEADAQRKEPTQFPLAAQYAAKSQSEEAGK